MNPGSPTVSGMDFERTQAGHAAAQHHHVAAAVLVHPLHHLIVGVRVIQVVPVHRQPPRQRETAHQCHPAHQPVHGAILDLVMGRRMVFSWGRVGVWRWGVVGQTDVQLGNPLYWPCVHSTTVTQWIQHIDCLSQFENRINRWIKTKRLILESIRNIVDLNLQIHRDL